ncbi:MAG TPA: glycosyltransferase family 1 protein [Aggregatilineales bacterium]|nr:glycosyltransferase family 1 protein [Aggregatilineales bacterium]
MRIAIDASRTTVARVTGTEQYAIALIRALIRLNDGSHNFTLYFRDAPPPDLFPDDPHVTQRVIPWRRAWTHLRFAAALWADRPDVTFVPAHTLPFVFPGRAVVTVHDLGYRVFPRAHKTRDRLYLDLTTRFSAWRATRVLADSQATAHDLTRFYGTPADKIHVVYPGVEPLPAGDVEAVRARYRLPARYFLFLGTLQPRKNIARIVQAYATYREAHGGDVGLVLAGGQGWLYDEAWTAGVDGVTLTGYVDDADRGALYAGAEALVFPSLYEGFGFPVLEALHAGTPVIASSTSSLPELVGDAGLLVDPLDVAAIARAMAAVKPDVVHGQAQAARFTWDAAGRAVLDVFAEIAGIARK